MNKVYDEIALSIMKKVVDTGELTDTDFAFLVMYRNIEAKENKSVLVSKLIDSIKNTFSNDGEEEI